MKFIKNIWHFRGVSIDRFRFSFYLAIVLVLVSNIFSIINRFNINKIAGINISANIFYLFAESIFAFMVMLIILLSISLVNKYLLKLISILFLLISPVVIYYNAVYKVVFDEFMIGNIIETPPGEANAFISIAPFIIFAVFGVLPAFIVIRYIKIQSMFESFKSFFLIKHWKNTLKHLVLYSLIPIVIIYLVLISIYPKLLTNGVKSKLALSAYIPINYTAGIIMYLAKVKKAKSSYTHLIKTDQEYPFIFNNKLKDKPITLVLLIGEASREKNQHYSGYKRDTNYYTEKIQNLTYFNKLYSCDTFTRGSIPCMLSYHVRGDYKEPITETNLISIFKNLGFETWWISGQTAYERKYNTIFSSASEADHVFFVSAIKSLVSSNSISYDNMLFPNIDKALQSPSKHKLLVIQLRGSHVDYRDDVPSSFDAYKPTCRGKSNCSPQESLNEYDNSLLYSDEFIAKLINKLKNRNSLLLYASDHGESLQVDHSGFLIHGAPYSIAPKVQKHISGMMWYSDNMFKLIPNKLVNIKKYHNRKISHDYVFSTMFDCLGIKSSVVKKDLSLCAKPSN